MTDGRGCGSLRPPRGSRRSRTIPRPRRQQPIDEWDEETLVLGIETSCDETSAAVVKGGREILSNVIVSQTELHGEYGGIVPEIAARAHVEALTPAIGEALLLRRCDVLGPRRSRRDARPRV